jgi:hypothetical protein
MPELKRNFLKSVFTNAALNFLRVRCKKHKDVLNCPFGWCGIQALGNFDHTKGGHLILWELCLVVEFPPGALILIPSASITHSNTPVSKDEMRHSFTQYCAGALFRYVDYGFRKEADLKKEDPEKFEEILSKREGRWEEGLSLFSKLEDFQPVTSALP